MNPSEKDPQQEAREKARRKIKLPTKSERAECFYPMLESFILRDELNEVVKNKIAKSCELMEMGESLHANGFVKNNNAAELAEQYGECDEEALAALAASGAEFSLAGRIVSHRSFGKVVFFHIMDASGRIQCYVAREHMDEESFAVFRKLDIGDIVGIRGTLFRTKTGELTVDCRHIKLLTRSFRTLPEKYHGLKDVETRYRQRYVDLIVTPRAREIAFKRIKIVSEFRRFMENEGFLEVETPMLQPIPGGAAAKPFITHHNALDMQLYMRIAPELYLKRLLVGGFEKVFELNRNFRNEGISVRHNPEFTMCEFYWAYATFENLMDLTERLFAHLAQTVCGATKIPYQGEEIDLTPGKWTRLTFHESLEKIGGHKPSLYNDYPALVEYIKSRGEKAVDGEKLGKLQAKLFDLDVEPKLIQPHFIYHYPTDISPLSRRNEANPDLTDRFELFIAGREMGNAFSELNDPMDQRARFEEQVAEKEAGDDEAHFMDEDYLRALEYGMPPAAGQGIGIDRLVMLLTDSASIREVILFPQLKPEA
ncbi:lysine tRNA synthetase, inducible [uncultured delta proteobacterium]|uniref:Lysine--tRNA ligase n=1 Tax=uncultured delta proteobacterium TaxID=34034 RepID=A0A212JW93_9DELT|nr:lysine tRNA synthetase, inducible [uncultured delta proteobacterium]